MTFAFYPNIPASGNSPSDDQPNMQTNNASINDIINVDHFTFNNTSMLGGYHKQIHFPNLQTPAAPTGSASIIYPGAGVVRPASPQTYMVNSRGTFILSAIRAMANITITSGSPIANVNYNCTITGSGTGAVTVTLTPNAVDSIACVVFANRNSGSACQWTSTFLSGVFTVTLVGVGTLGFNIGDTVCLIVLQI